MRTKQTGRKAEVSELPSKNVITRETLIVDDIKHTICELLDGIKSGCSFATFGAFSEAPLPDLVLEGYGQIPLPLAERDVKNICKERKEGDGGKGWTQLRTAEGIAKGDRTGFIPQVVKSVDRGSALHGQWEMESDNIGSFNPAWNGFVQKIALKAARDLGIKPDARSVEAKLIKARLWAAWANMPPHKSVSAMVDSFGKLLIILPAAHYGGHVLLSYDGKTEEFVTETSCRWNYSYIAWHTDAIIELKPLNSGHRLMLEYDLVLPSPAKLPSLAEINGEKGKLRDVLTTWNNAVTKDCTTQNLSFPTLLAHVCDSIYNSQYLNLNMLQGNDQFRAAYLRDLCASFDMGLYIANLDRTLTGFCEDYHDDDDYYMGVEDEDSIVLTKVVDLDGNTVGSDLAIEFEDNFVASDSFDEGPDSQDNDRNHGLVTYHYRRTVLVLIPSAAKAEWFPVESHEKRPNKRKRSVESTDDESDCS